MKEADGDKRTARFYQEICGGAGHLVEVHEKYPEDKGHRQVEEQLYDSRSSCRRTQIDRISLPQVEPGRTGDRADWAMMDTDLDEKTVETLRDVIARLDVADVRAFGLS